MSKTTITREDLYTQVWAQPMLHLAKTYGMSNVGLAKLCRRHDIPRPPRGYWRKLEVGEKPKKVPLPPSKGSSEITIYSTDERHFAESELGNEVEQLQAAEDRPDAKIVVADTLRGAHDLVKTTNQEFAGAKRDESGMLNISEEPSLNVTVSRDQLRRALLVMDAILKALQSRGCQIATGPNVEMFGESVPFGIKEVVRTEREQPEEHDLSGRYEFGHSRYCSVHVPSGRLALFIADAEGYWASGCRKQWRDAKKQKVEHCLNKFVAGLIKVAAKKRDHRLAKEREEAEQAEAEKKREAEAQRRAEMRKQKAQEQAKLDLLLQQADSWRKSKDIRMLVEAVRAAKTAQVEEVASGSELDEWISWALMHADRLDPTKESPPSILDEHIPEEPKRWY